MARVFFGGVRHDIESEVTNRSYAYRSNVPAGNIHLAGAYLQQLSC